MASKLSSRSKGKKLMIKLYTIILACCLCIGCGSGVDSSGLNHEQQNLKSNIPVQATNVEYLGNFWCKFELEVDGVDRKFLFYRKFRHAAVTELKD